MSIEHYYGDIQADDLKIKQQHFYSKNSGNPQNFSHQNFLALEIFWLYGILQHVASVWFILLEAICYAHFMVETSTFSYLAS